jgi:starch synthase
VKLRVVHIVSELSPITGESPAGLAEAYLCRAQSARRLDVRVIAPRPPELAPARFGLARALTPLPLPGGEVVVHEGRLPDGRTHLTLCDAPPPRFAAAAVALLRRAGPWPHVVHARPATAEALALVAAAAGPDGPALFGDLDGIPRGIDEHSWRPDADAHLPAPFSAADPAGKARCKLALQRALGLPPRPRAPLCAVLPPLAPALLDVPTAEALVGTGVQLAVLAAPDRDEAMADRMRQLASRHYTRVAARAVATTDPEHEALAHQLIAGADLVLYAHPFPAEGPSDLACLRYGALPIAPADDGYGAALVELCPRTLSGSGALYTPGDGAALVAAVRRAARAFREATDWPALARRLMTLDLSWATAAQRSEERYRAALRAQA